MGSGFIILGFLCLLLLICSVLLFYVIKNRGYFKTAVFVSVFLAGIVIVPLIIIVFESELYFKSDVEKDLLQVNLSLKEDFNILSNEIMGMPEYYQTTYLQIAENDRNRIIDEIEKSEGFKNLKSNDITLSNKMLYSRNLQIEKNEIWNYQSKNTLVRELYLKENEYVPISITVSVKKDSDTLIIYRIED